MLNPDFVPEKYELINGDFYAPMIMLICYSVIPTKAKVSERDKILTGILYLETPRSA